MSPNFSKRQDNANFTCPLGGNWYACASDSVSKFVGCCTSDPCTNGCFQGNTFSAGLNPTIYGKLPDASCEIGSSFYTCTSGITFWGCCKTNPCANNSTCAGGDLTPAFMARPEQFSAYVTASTSSSPTASATASNSPSNSDESSSNGAIIGGAVGGGIGGALIIGALIWFLCRRRKQRNQQYAAAPIGDTAHPAGREKGNATNSNYYDGQSPPPTYTSPNPNMYPASPHTPKNNPYQQYAYISEAPQELPGDNHSSSAGNRYSELPAGPSNTSRFSELPAGAAPTSAELESPQTSPTPLQTEFRRDLAKIEPGPSNGDEIARH